MKQNDSITKARLRCHISWLADELFRLTGENYHTSHAQHRKKIGPKIFGQKPETLLTDGLLSVFPAANTCPADLGMVDVYKRQVVYNTWTKRVGDLDYESINFCSKVRYTIVTAAAHLRKGAGAAAGRTLKIEYAASGTSR